MVGKDQRSDNPAARLGESCCVRKRATRFSMTFETLLTTASLVAGDYRCAAKPADRPFVERHGSHCLAYVRRGSFGCSTRGRSHELVAGSMFIGYPGDEYACTHEHHESGDECLSFNLSPALIASLDDRSTIWRVGSLPPLPELVVLGELAQAAAEGRTDVALEEAAVLLVERFVEVVRGRTGRARVGHLRDRRRAVEAALWIEAKAGESVMLEDAARHVGLSDFHFLRLFRASLGLTPHQFLVRCRLRRAARLLSEGGAPITDIAFESGFGDLSNFIRTFRRAARVSPRVFRRMARNDRNLVRERLARRAMR